jgi:SAM-dependent methyltransferase
MPKRPFIRKPKRRRHGQSFWEHEYTAGGHLKLSDDAGEDLIKFTRWHQRQKDVAPLGADQTALDLGCGNGRHLFFLYEKFGLSGIGYDTAPPALKHGQKRAAAFAPNSPPPITLEQRSIAEPLPLADESVDVALDMMASHFLNSAERGALRDEIHRVLKPGGWLFMKTFLQDGDLHTKRLLAEHPSNEPGTYIHPVIGVPEHAYTEAELTEFLKERFLIHKVYRSHQHQRHGQARKRRTVCVYAQKDPYR